MVAIAHFHALPNLATSGPVATPKTRPFYSDWRAPVACGKNYDASLPRSSILRRVVTGSRARVIAGLFDSHAEFDEKIVLFSVRPV